ncbi:MAG: hypothetical protein KAU50_11115, partial [Candidatus Marinimicrobia bacterium]|nr:hypothetical protein [Candidatus Neomarinimicrobiota bacterium]
MAEGPALHTPGLFYLFAALSILYFLYNSRRALAVRVGRPEPRTVKPLTMIRNGLLFGLAQSRVTSRRFSYATVMHFCLGWGFIELFFATTVDFIVERGPSTAWLPVKDTPWFAALNDLGGLLMLVGIVMALIRRHGGNRPELLPHNAFRGRGLLLGDTGLLLVLLLLVVGGFLTEAARLAIETPSTASASIIGYSLSRLVDGQQWAGWQPWLWWSHAFLALALIAVLPRTKLYHAIIGIVNVALTSNEERGELRSMNIAQLMDDPDLVEDDLVLGAGQVSDFTWKQLLDAQACTECARCTSVCPAYAAGMPL